MGPPHGKLGEVRGGATSPGKFGEVRGGGTPDQLGEVLPLSKIFSVAPLTSQDFFIF